MTGDTVAMNSNMVLMDVGALLESLVSVDDVVVGAALGWADEALIRLWV
jgi:hypothetical protein